MTSVPPLPWLSPRTRTIAGLFALALVLAFGFLGSRPLWEPDEGRYTNVALTMLESGDWVDPMRNDDTGHWSKPPATYWALASSFAAFGINTWAARLPSALSLLACVLLVWLTARRLARGAQTLAALVYATMLLPSAAGQMVTTDFLLAACEAPAGARRVSQESSLIRGGERELCRRPSRRARRGSVATARARPACAAPAPRARRRTAIPPDRRA